MNNRILAVAKNTFKDYFFNATSVFLVIMFLLIPFLCSNLLGDGTAEGKFRVFVTYSFLISSIIFTVANISFSCSSISSEWKNKTLLTLDVKPIKRWEIIFGKWLGMLFINLVFIAFFILSMSFSSLLVSYKLRENFSEHINIFKTKSELFPVLTSESSGENRSSESQPRDFRFFLFKKAEDRKENYVAKAAGRLDWSFKGIKLPSKTTVPANSGQEASEDIYLSYRFQTAGSKEQIVSGYWLVGNSSLSGPFELGTNLLADKIHRLPIPPQAVSADGQVDIAYLNIDSSNISVLFPSSDFKLLYSHGNYWVNLLKGAANILILVTFIFSIGLCFSCLVSHLTAILATSILMSIAYMHEFIEIVAEAFFREMQVQQQIQFMHRMSYHMLRFFSFIFPPLNEALPHSYIGSSLLIPSDYLFALFMRIIVLGALPALIVAMVYLSYRELGIPNE